MTSTALVWFRCERYRRGGLRAAILSAMDELLDELQFSLRETFRERAAYLQRRSAAAA